MTGYELVRRPSRRSVAVAGLAGTFAVVASVPGGPLPTGLALGGVVVLLAGVRLGRHGVVDGGALVAIGGEPPAKRERDRNGNGGGEMAPQLTHTTP